MKETARAFEPAVLTATQAAERLACHPKTVRALCRNGLLRAVKLGSEWRIPVEALQEFLSSK